MSVLDRLKKSLLPTQPSQPRTWEEGSVPPLRNCKAWAAARFLKGAGLGQWLTRRLLWQGSWKKQLYALAWLIFFCYASYGMLTRFVVMAVVVQGRSMLPTLKDGERYLLNRLTYLYRPPQRYELVVIRDPGHNDYAVKRIVGMPGETIRFQNGQVYVNGQKLDESFLNPGTKTFYEEEKETLIMIGKDRYFVLGDNRSCSEDSRSYGTVPRKRIIGLLAR